MPKALFYPSVVMLATARRSVSQVAKALLAVPDRGGLRNATFHTLRTYLTPLHGLLHDWLKPFPDLGPPPPVYQEAQNWLRTRSEAAENAGNIAPPEAPEESSTIEHSIT